MFLNILINSASCSHASEILSQASSDYSFHHRAIVSTLALGEDPAVFTTDNVRISIQKPLTSALLNATIQSPATTAEAQYGALQPNIALSSDFLAACGLSDLYVELSVMQWGANPYPNSSDLKSGLFRLGSITGDSGSARKRRHLANEYVFTLPTAPLYFITLQFDSRQDLGNYSNITLNDLYGNSTKNFSLPDCTFNDGTQYVPCQGCNISSFTEYNVTYGCYDASQLCPATVSSRRSRGLRRYFTVALE
jgi:hypothetical protein